MNNASPKVVQVTTTQDCWKALHAVALEMAMQYGADSRADLLTNLLKIVPTISAASETPELDDLEAWIRDAARSYMEDTTRRTLALLAQELPPEDTDDFIDGLDVDGPDFSDGPGRLGGFDLDGEGWH